MKSKIIILSVFFLVNSCQKQDPKVFSSKIFPTDDACVCSGEPNKNFGSDSILYTGDPYIFSGGYIHYNSYLKFDISTIPSNAKLTKAELILHTMFYKNLTPGPQGDVNIYYISDTSWSESTITYSNKPYPVNNTAIAIRKTVTFNVISTIDIDIFSHLIDYFKTSSKYSLMVHTDCSYYCGFYSKERNAPYLNIEYEVK